ASVIRAAFQSVEFENAIFFGCDLREASFVNCHLVNSSFVGAHFLQTYFEGTSLVGSIFFDTDLSRARGLTDGQLVGTIGDSTTKLPDCVRGPAKGAGRKLSADERHKMVSESHRDNLH